MEDRIIEATIQSLASVSHSRFFQSERGYQGNFYHYLHQHLEAFGVLDEISILIEEEYQKTAKPHITRQRPDIILHIPREETGAPVNENNFAVWAFKLDANQIAAEEDYNKLDEMFDNLNYPLGFFVNINSNRHFLQNYSGLFPSRIIEFAVEIRDNSISISQAFWEDGVVKVQKIQ